MARIIERLHDEWEEPAAWILICLLAGILFFIATTSGIGLVSDSFFYIGGTEGILAGEGFARPAADGTFKVISHFPPGYSIALSIVDVFLPHGWSLRGCNLILFVANVLLVGIIVRRRTGRFLLGLMASLMWMVSPALLGSQFSVLSEGLFYAILLLYLGQWFQYEESQRVRDLVFAGALAGLLYLTRYSGAAFLVPGAAFLLLDSRYNFLERSNRLLIFSCAALILPIGWAVRNIVHTGSSSNRILSWHPISATHLYRASDTVVHWFVPIDLPGRVEIALFGGLLLFVFIVGIRDVCSGPRQPSSSSTGHTASGFFIAISIWAYLALLSVSISFFDASTPLDSRILSPVYVLLLLFAFLLAGRCLEHGRRWLNRIIWAGIILALSGTGVRGVREILISARQPAGFAHPSWQESIVIDFVEGLEDGELFYSNEIDGLYLLTGRMAYLIPVQWDPVTLLEREDFPDQLAMMRERLAEGDGYLLLFSSLERQDFFPPAEVLTQDLQLVMRDSTVEIYRP